MIYITYENKKGKLNFGGGDSPHSFKILDIEGLNLPPKSLNTVSYPTEVGQSTISETIGARTITMQCDVHGINSNRHEISKALKILNEPGDLIIRNGCTTRKIGARCTNASQSERHGGYQVLTIQFICDYPYFEDRENTTIPIFKREDLIKTPFTLPYIFSKRTSEANILNMGDVDTEPVIIITMLGDSYSGEDANTLQIINTTTEQTLHLAFPANIITKDAHGVESAVSYTPVNGDVITLDIPNRRIYSQNGYNLISCLSQTSFLSDFWLKTGVNMVKVKNHISNSCTVVSSFSNKYVEAVIA